MSETTVGSALAKALAKAQGVMESARRDKNNPAFGSKNRYADLASVWDACREPLSANGLAVAQLVTAADKSSVTVETRLMHEGGETLSSVLTMPVERPTAQGVGSAITYARRYALAALVGVAPDDDDDGNVASGVAPKAAHAPVPPSPPRSNVVQMPNSSAPGAPTNWEVRINEAQTCAALAAVASELQRQPEAVRDSHRDLYTRRYTELAAREKARGGK